MVLRAKAQRKLKFRRPYIDPKLYRINFAQRLGSRRRGTHSSSTDNLKFVTCVNKLVRAGTVERNTHPCLHSMSDAHGKGPALHLQQYPVCVRRIARTFIGVHLQTHGLYVEGLVDAPRCRPLSGAKLRHRTDQGNRHTCLIRLT